ncbi:hypothetical protein [Pseudanabaena sp. 'Roaring Creek']|nr:hypothetical protein [Pseudanabaena sp. 'Roaring Creek']
MSYRFLPTLQAPSNLNDIKRLLVRHIFAIAKIAIAKIAIAILAM